MELTEKEQKRILSALLFGACTDCCTNDTQLDDEADIELAIKLSKMFGSNDLTDTNLYIYSGAVFDQELLVNKIKENFKVRFEE